MQPRDIFLEIRDKTQEEVLDFIETSLFDLGVPFERDDRFGIVGRKGDIKMVAPFLTAHTDVISRPAPRDEVEEVGGILKIKDDYKDFSVCLGGDDRAGVAVLLDFISKYDGFFFGFFVDEESGSEGAKRFLETSLFTPEKYSFILGLDRRGCYSVAIYLGLENYDLLDHFLDVNEVTYGSSSDCVVIAQEAGVGVVNLGVGYEYEHSPEETQNLTFLNLLPLILGKTLDKIENRVFPI